MSNGQVNQFVGTLEELLRFLESYKEDLFYFDINPTTPPQGTRQFEITTFPAERAEAVLDEIHPLPGLPKLTPLAKTRIELARPIEEPKPPRLVECGMNIHPFNREGYPLNAGHNTNLTKTAWVRFPFMSSPARFPSPDPIAAAFQFFDPVIRDYNQAGVKIILVLTHEMYGEGSEFNLGGMDGASWAAFTVKFVAAAERIIRRYGDQVQAYEIWNEGDVEPGNPAAVYIPPREYALLLDRIEPIIRRHAPEATIVSGGLVRGPEIAAQYINTMKSALNGRLPLDAIGYHPYGKGAPKDSTVFSRLGSIADDLRIIGRAAPNIPVWLTEIGALGTDDPAFWDDAALYLNNFFRYIRSDQAERAPVIVWYAWSDAMHIEMKTNGLITRDGQKKPHLFDAFFNEACRT